LQIIEYALQGSVRPSQFSKSFEFSTTENFNKNVVREIKLKSLSFKVAPYDTTEIFCKTVCIASDRIKSSH